MQKLCQKYVKVRVLYSFRCKGSHFFTTMQNKVLNFYISGDYFWIL